MVTANLHAYAVITPLSTLAQHCKRLSPLIAAPAALLLSQGQAKAMLTYNIFESAGNVVIQTSGTLDLSGATPFSTFGCSSNGRINSSLGTVCSGPDTISTIYRIGGPATFNGNVDISGASNVSGIFTAFSGGGGGTGIFGIDPTYISNTPIVSSTTFNGTTLAGIGFTTTGLIGTWTLDGTSETFQLILGPPTAAVPGPLPLLGAGAAFGWSRRLRKRIATPSITTPQD